MPRPLHPDSDPEAQEEFKKTFPTVLSMLSEGHPAEKSAAKQHVILPSGKISGAESGGTLVARNAAKSFGESCFPGWGLNV
jgi:hypothetical protein